MSHHVIWCGTIGWHVLWRKVMPYHVMSFDTCHTISCSRVISCHSISYQFISCHVIPTSLLLIRAIFQFFFFFLRWVDISYKIKLSSIPLPTNGGHARKISLPSSTCALRFVARPTSFAQVPPFPSNACQSRGLDFTSMQKISLLFTLSS